MKTLIEKQIELFEATLSEYRERNLKVCASSSFQTHSIPMLHILSRIDRSIPIYFLDTGFHFPETLTFKDQVTELFGLNLIPVSSPVSKCDQKDAAGKLLFASDPDYCCYLNKTLPMEQVLATHDVWISGVRKDQNANRQGFEMEEPGAFQTVRFHPMLNWTGKMIWQYIREHNLPRHPLDGKGYISIGCLPCTLRPDLSGEEGERSGRWSGLNKTECGLHTDLVSK